MVNKDKLVLDLCVVIFDIEELLCVIVGVVGEKVGDLCECFSLCLCDVKECLVDLEVVVVEKIKVVVCVIDDFVYEELWKVVGVVVVLGFVFGVLIGCC